MFNKNSVSLIPIGLVFGSGIGIIIGSIFSYDIGLSMIIGSAIGLVMGAIFHKSK